MAPTTHGRTRLPPSRSGVLVVLLAAALGAVAAPASLAAEPSPAERPPAALPAQRTLAKPRNDLQGLPNFAKVSDALYRGAQPSSAGFGRLKRMGVRTVVNLRTAHSDRKAMAGHGLKYLPISFKAWHAEGDDVVPFLKVMTQPEHQPVFVHCQHGSDRTGTMVAVYRICLQGWSKEDAMKELPLFGFHTFWQNLRAYLRGLDPASLMRKVKSAKSPRLETIR